MSEKIAARRYLKSQMGQRRDMEDFRREALERFNNMGFKVQINFYETNLDGVYLPEIVVTERLTPWDPDREVHEAVHDVAGTGKRGWIREDGTIKDPALKVQVPKKL
jgi:hypothetical protein